MKSVENAFRDWGRAARNVDCAWKFLQGDSITSFAMDYSSGLGETFFQVPAPGNVCMALRIDLDGDASTANGIGLSEFGDWHMSPYVVKLNVAATRGPRSRFFFRIPK